MIQRQLRKAQKLPNKCNLRVQSCALSTIIRKSYYTNDNYVAIDT